MSAFIISWDAINGKNTINDEKTRDKNIFENFESKYYRPRSISQMKSGDKFVLAFTENGQKYAVKVLIESVDKVEDYNEEGIIFKLED